MFKNLKRKLAKATLVVFALQLAFMGLGTGATGAYAADGEGYDGVIDNFTLYNSETDLPIMELESGAKINMALAEIGDDLNIVANTLPETVGSVRFELTGAEVSGRTEGVAPYALKGDTDGDFYDWEPTVGTYVLTATSYELAGLGGEVGVPETITFTVYDDAVAPMVEGGFLDESYLLNEEVVADENPLKVEVSYNEMMDTDSLPVLTFTPDISSSVVCEGEWASGDDYLYTCTLIDADVELVGVTGTIAGAKDLAGNEQVVFAPLTTLDIDTKAPTAVMTAKSPTNEKTIPVTLNFSETVEEFDLTMLTVVNGTAQNLTGSLASYKFDIVPTGITKVQEITVDLTVGAVEDLNDNHIAATEQLKIHFDPESPAAVTGVTTLVNADGHVTISWVNPPAGTYSSLRLVRVGDFTVTLSLGTTSYTDLTTEKGKTYQYVIIVGDEASNETALPAVSVTVPAPVVAAAVSDTVSVTPTNTNTETEVKAEVTGDDTDTKDQEEFPVWGIILLVILAAVGAYLIWNQKPVVEPVVKKTNKK